MNRDKREPEYPTELESQFILRLPEEPAKLLKEILETGDNLKNRLTIKVDNDMRHGEVCLDHWLMHAKIIDLPTIIESLKTIDNKSFYKAADICQMMICKEGPEEPSTEEECPVKNKKKDPNKVDKKFLYPHGITPPTKNVRKRRFRKTLKKKSAEAPDIEKEVKRLLRADNEAENITWEVITETDDEQLCKPEPPPPVPVKPEKKGKQKSKANVTSAAKNTDTSNVVDIFGGAVSDSDLEEDSTKVDVEHSKRLIYESRKSDKKSKHGKSGQRVKKNVPITFQTDMYINSPKPSTSTPSTSGMKSGALSSEDDGDYSRDMSKENMSSRIEQLGAELAELKQRKQKTQHEISGLENAALRQRFQDILHNLNKDIMYKEMEYQGIITLQNSDDI